MSLDLSLDLPRNQSLKTNQTFQYERYVAIKYFSGNVQYRLYETISEASDNMTIEWRSSHYTARGVDI